MVEVFNIPYDYLFVVAQIQFRNEPIMNMLMLMANKMHQLTAHSALHLLTQRDIIRGFLMSTV